MSTSNGALPVEYPEASYLRDLAQRFESPEDANNLRAIASQIDWLNRELNAARKSISDGTSRVAAMRAALENCVVVMDDAGRAAAMKELTDDELGRLWLSTVEQARAALEAK